jgi:DNA polymerase sigma
MEPLRKELERLLQPKFPGCKLKAYGSGANGFTMVSSDFDLTIILQNSVTDPDQKCMILRQLEPLIRLQGYHIEDRLSARTPVLKCTHPSNIELDLSVGNLVAVCNSELLNTYAELDERVRALGIILKHWAKKRQIADAAKGYLSSYSYIVLLIAYLQRTTPPLVPNLQAGYYGCERDMIEGHDCTFEKNVQQYKEMVETNRAAIGELLVGFFRHYGYEFDWETAVVTMRLPSKLSKTDKNWRTGIAIEDPFELNRNLGDVAKVKYQEILEEFKWAAYFLSKGAQFESICNFGFDR